MLNFDILGLERYFKEISQNLRKFGSSKKEFQFQAVEVLPLTQHPLVSLKDNCPLNKCEVNAKLTIFKPAGQIFNACRLH